MYNNITECIQAVINKYSVMIDWRQIEVRRGQVLVPTSTGFAKFVSNEHWAVRTN